jgi:hypothetical protein
LLRCIDDCVNMEIMSNNFFIMPSRDLIHNRISNTLNITAFGARTGISMRMGIQVFYEVSKTS